jgi:thioredoxin-related protein
MNITSDKRLEVSWTATLLVLLLLMTASAFGQDDATERDPREYFFSQTFGDLPEELGQVKKEGKKGILLFFEAEGCPYCLYMLRNVFNQKKVQDWYREHFLSIAVDIHGDVDIKDFDGITLPSKVFAAHRKVVITPIMSFVDLDGAEVYRHLGMVKTPEEFLVMGEYIAGGHYFYTEFSTYAKKQGLHEHDEILITPGRDTAKPGSD